MSYQCPSLFFVHRSLAKSQRIAGVVAVLLLVGLVAPTVCLAQSVPRYQPSRPTISPYINLLRNNNSAVPNYYSFVRPMQQQMAFNQEQLQFQVRQNAAIRELQAGQLTSPGQGPVTGTSSWFQTPGSRSTFLNTSQYFNRAGGRR